MSGYKSSDGLVTSSTPEGAALVETIIAAQRGAKGNWTDTLRAAGVKFAAPDDGWVHRSAEPPYATVSWYPLFNDHPEVGDLIAFGWPTAGEFCMEEHNDDGVLWMWYGYRICRVVDVNEHHSKYPGMDATYFYYEDTGLRMPPVKPTPVSRLRRLFKRVAA